MFWRETCSPLTSTQPALCCFRELLKNPKVIFAGYVIKHPLDTSVHVIIRTKEADYPPKMVREQQLTAVALASSTF